MEQFTNSINTNKLVNTIETLSSINNCLSSYDLKENFVNIEEYLTNINFEHGSCFNNYKDEINIIYDLIDTIKKEIVELNNSIEATVDSFSISDSLDISSLEDNSTNISLRKALSSFTQIPSSDTGTSVTTTNSNTSSTINTIPIGLGIAATGISASIGAVVVDSMNSKNNKRKIDYSSELEDYQDSIETKKEEKELDAFASEKEIVPNESYKASSRNKENLEKFFDDDLGLDEYKDEN
jgi:hypothetical protein